MEMIGERTDQELLREFVMAGAERPFEELVRRHREMVLEVSRRVLHDAQWQQDVTQLVFMALSRRAPWLLEHTSLAGWLHRTALHVALRVRRSNLTRRRHEIESAKRRSPRIRPDELADPELTAELHRAIASLPDRFREPVVLHHLEGRTIEEGAFLMGCKVGTFASWLSRARRMLRESLGARGVMPGTAVAGVWFVEEFAQPPVAQGGETLGTALLPRHAGAAWTATTGAAAAIPAGAGRCMLGALIAWLKVPSFSTALLLFAVATAAAVPVVRQIRSATDYKLPSGTASVTREPHINVSEPESGSIPVLLPEPGTISMVMAGAALALIRPKRAAKAG